MPKVRWLALAASLVSFGLAGCAGGARGGPDGGAGCTPACGAGLRCLAGSCVPTACSSAGDCPAGWSCLGGFCSSGACSPPCGASDVCVAGACRSPGSSTSGGSSSGSGSGSTSGSSGSGSSGSTSGSSGSGGSSGGGTACAVQGFPGFAAAKAYPIAAFSVAVADFNGDGKPDIAVAAGTAGVGVSLNQGNGQFGAESSYLTGSQTTSVAAGDFNGDGKPDLAAITADGMVHLFLNQGSGTFAGQLIVSAGSAGDTPLFVVAGDLNGDGKPDLAVANSDYGTGSSTVDVLLNQGGGTFGSPVAYAVGNDPDSVAVGDFNGDGKPDLAVASLNDNAVSVLLNQGNGTFGARATYAVGTYPTSVTVGDFNGDGKPDLAVANSGDGRVGLLLNAGGGTFASEVTYFVGMTPTSVVAADFDGDGKPDLATANTGDDTVSVLLNQGSGTFAAQTTYAITGNGNYTFPMAAGDFNRDGKPDLAVALVGGLDVLLALCGPTPGAPDAGSCASSGFTGFSVGQTVPGAPNFSAGAVAGDFTGGGKPDLALGPWSTTEWDLLSNEGNGALAAPLKYPAVVANGHSEGFAMGDLNGDGKPDLAFIDATNMAVDVVLNQGGGTFAAPVAYPVGNLPDSVAVGDFNGDGKPDLAVANGNGDTVSVLLNSGGGTFQAQLTYAAGSAPGHVAVGDFNHDGKPDLAVVNGIAVVTGSTVGVLLNQGGGTFAAPVSYGVGSGPVSLNVGDFNGDGSSDLAVVNLNDSTVSVLLAQGGGTFAAQQTYAVGPLDATAQFLQPAVGDFNGDGKPDLAVPNYGAGTLGVLLNQGNGTFAAQLTYAVGLHPDSVAVADFNGDGRLDLAVHNVFDATVKLLVNQCP